MQPRERRSRARSRRRSLARTSGSVTRHRASSPTSSPSTLPAEGATRRSADRVSEGDGPEVARSDRLPADLPSLARETPGRLAPEQAHPHGLGRAMAVGIAVHSAVGLPVVLRHGARLLGPFACAAVSVINAATTPRQSRRQQSALARQPLWGRQRRAAQARRRREVEDAGRRHRLSDRCAPRRRLARWSSAGTATGRRPSPSRSVGRRCARSASRTPFGSSTDPPPALSVGRSEQATPAEARRHGELHHLHRGRLARPAARHPLGSFGSSNVMPARTGWPS